MKMSINGMEHTNSTVMVFQSNDYSLFRMIKGNRSLDMNKIKRILSDIEGGTNLLKYYPILVTEKNGKLEIDDGQHRFAVCKKIKSPVYYILADNMSLYDIARSNSNQEKWKVTDFINCYKELGNVNYIKLDELLQKYSGLPATVAVTLLSKKTPVNTGHTQLLNNFHRGEFVVNYEKETIAFLNKIMEIDFPYKLTREFMAAINKVSEAGIYPVDELISKVNASPEQLKKQDHWRRYLTNLEEIVGKGKQKRVAIY